MYRSGGISSLLTPGGGITLGRNMFTDTTIDEIRSEDLRFHENYHIQRQEEMEWVEFYMRTAHEYLKYGFPNTYRTPGTLENETDKYMYEMRHKR